MFRAPPAQDLDQLVAAGHDPAVDVENRAGNPAGLIGEQIGDGVGDVGRGADSSQGMKRREGVKRRVDLVLGDKPLVEQGFSPRPARRR